MIESDKKRGPLLKYLDELEAKCSERDLTLKEILEVFGSDGHYVLLTFFIIPFTQPVPMLGLSTPFGVMIAIVAIFAYLKKPPWLPKRWEAKTVSAKTVAKIAEGVEKVFEKISKILKPRMGAFFKEPFRFLNVLLIVINSLLLALPLPIPFSNALPAMAILMQGLAHLEEDGFFIVLSYVQTVACFIYFFFIFKGVDSGLEFLKL